MQSVIAILASSILMLLISGPMHAAAKNMICPNRDNSNGYCVQMDTGAPIIPKIRNIPGGMFPTFTCASDYLALCCPSIPVKDLKQCKFASSWE
ncbi:hypothetical protein PGT21_024821 [Puccinia graminis f. sp. tritici]|uniref:Hydrophobin n=2 Tax=Puccinia graminis f. sp. tritici TaxID=56615 RepID=E3LAS1_PUCGT|nr:uncharacterized protein PGTG_19595 [Puccinia graminis f. sp. tritici CRL 75-36-700-3]EFP93646.2 hypothetical protein PGTG_19595 [Puccinia graminis f. sp. tritici CRL 75-36-700-3]KAA1108765.1 hypothetical protein PGT21_024821 [Puccinia graminis f. sp. tritici]KAA1122285.1 hypothetical protein PGTUg99_036163 [Puccinia graminis f. sp. tritici]